MYPKNGRTSRTTSILSPNENMKDCYSDRESSAYRKTRSPVVQGVGDPARPVFRRSCTNDEGHKRIPRKTEDILERNYTNNGTKLDFGKSHILMVSTSTPISLVASVDKARCFLFQVFERMYEYSYSTYPCIFHVHARRFDLLHAFARRLMGNLSPSTVPYKLPRQAIRI